MTPDVPAESLLALTRYYHQSMDELLWWHQEALLIQDLPLARTFWELFQQGLAEHISIENQQLFMAFEQHINAPRWPVLLYRKEHEKILTMCDKANGMLDKLQQRWPDYTASQQRRAILTVLEYQRTLRNVVEHHEEREEMALLPEMDEQLADGVRSKLIEQMRLAWQQSHQQRIDQAQPLLTKLE